MWKPKRIQHADVAFVQHSKGKNAVGRQKLNTLTTMIFSSLHCGNILITQSAVFIFIYSSPEYFGKTWLKCKQNILAILLMYIISIQKKTKTEQSYNVIARTTFHIYCKEPKYCDISMYHHKVHFFVFNTTAENSCFQIPVYYCHTVHLG